MKSLPSIEAQLQIGAGLVLVGQSAEVADSIASIMQKAGRTHQWHLVKLESESPADTLDVLQGSPTDIANTLVQLYPSLDNNIGAMYYRDMSVHALEVIVAALQAIQAPVRLQSLVDLTASDSVFKQWVAAVNAKLPDTHSARVNLHNFLDRAQRTVVASPADSASKLLCKAVGGGILGRITQLTQVPTGHAFNSAAPEHNLEDIISRRDVLYVQVPVWMSSEVERLAQLVLESTKRTIDRRLTGAQRMQFADDNLHGVLF